MIKINGEVIENGNYPDDTLLLKCDPQGYVKTNCAKLSWYYENDREFLTLIYLVKHLRAHDVNNIYLYMPYIPNARMDRVKNPEDVFTLKYFAELLNSLNLSRVEVLDPHSSVSEALINNICIITPNQYIKETLERIALYDHKKNSIIMFYPDSGSVKRYADMVQLPYAFGIKRRDWKTGKIEGLDVAGAVDQIAGKDILIVDDICSKGGTFYHSAKKLKELGAKDIYLYVSHCENTVLDGELLKGDLIKRVYTTDSIFTKEHEKIEVLK